MVFTNNNSGYRTARDLIARGVHVAAVIDSRRDVANLDAGGARVVAGAVITRVVGSTAVNEVKIRHERGQELMRCQFVAMSGGFNPVVHLSCHRGARPVWNDELAAFLSPAGDGQLTATGAAAGRMELAACLADGAEKGAKAAAELGFEPKPPELPAARSEAYRITPLWWVKESTGKAFVDYQNDVTAKDIPLTAREGYRDVELLKRYTTLGMATDQGKLPPWSAAQSSPRRPARASPRSAPRHSGRITRRSPSELWPDPSPVIISSRCARRRCTSGRRKTARCSWRPACGCARRGFRDREKATGSQA